MSSDLDLGVGLDFKKAMESLKKFTKSTADFNKSQEKALSNQIALQKQLNKLRGFQPPPLKPRNIPPRDPSNPTPKPVDTDTKNVAKVNAAIRKRTDNEIKEQQRLEVSRAKARLNSTREEQELISNREASRRKQAVSRITAPSGAESMKDFYKQQAKDANELAKVEARRVKSLQKARDAIQSSAIMQKKATNEVERQLQEQINLALSEEKSSRKLRNRVRKLKSATAELKRQNFLMKRMKSSSEQFAGNMVSAFAIAAAGAAVTKVGQSMEGVESGLLAVSGNAEKAAENLKFVREESFRLGKPLKESADAYTKMLAARGNLSTQQTRDTFTAIQETAVVLGLSADEANRGTRAIAQMMSKGSVTPEELKLQLAEAGFANAIPEMVKSAQEIGLIDKGLKLTEATQAFFKLQQDGKVITEEILPTFSKRMKEFAAAGLAKKLESNTTTMGKFFNIIESSSNVFFKSGFSEGLTDFFNSTAKMIKDNESLWMALSKVIGSALKVAAFVIEYIISPVVDALGSILYSVTSTLGDFSAAMALAFSPALWVLGLGKATKGVAAFSGALRGLLSIGLRIVAPFLGILAVLEEIALFFHNPTGKETLLGVGVKDFAKNMKDNSQIIAKARSQGVTGGYNSGSYGTMAKQQPFSYRTQQPIYVSTKLEVDSEVLAESFVEAQAGKDGIDRRISNASQGNYN